MTASGLRYAPSTAIATPGASAASALVKRRPPNAQPPAQSCALPLVQTSAANATSAGTAHSGRRRAYAIVPASAIQTIGVHDSRPWRDENRTSAQRESKKFK